MFTRLQIGFVKDEIISIILTFDTICQAGITTLKLKANLAWKSAYESVLMLVAWSVDIANHHFPLHIYYFPSDNNIPIGVSLVCSRDDDIDSIWSGIIVNTVHKKGHKKHIESSTIQTLLSNYYFYSNISIYFVSLIFFGYYGLNIIVRKTLLLVPDTYITHFKPSSAGIDLRRQHLTSVNVKFLTNKVDPRTARVKIFIIAVDL